MGQFKEVLQEQRLQELKDGDENRERLDKKIYSAHKMVLKEYNNRYKDKPDSCGILRDLRSNEEIDRRERVRNMMDKLERS